MDSIVQSSPVDQIAYFALEPNVYIALPVVLLFLTTIAVALRIYVRAVILDRLGLDDYTLLLAYAVFIVLSAFFIATGVQQLKNGIRGLISSMGLAAQVAYLVQGVCLKFALATFFLRFVCIKWQRHTIIAAVIIYAIYTLAFMLVTIFECGPPLNLSKGDHSNCLPWSTLGTLTYISASLNAIVDWMLTLTPVLVIIDLQIPSREKVSVCILILLGTLGSIVSVARIPLVATLKYSIDRYNAHNVLAISFMSIAECALGTIAISLAAIRPLFHPPPSRTVTARSQLDTYQPWQGRSISQAVQKDEHTSETELVHSKDEDTEWHPMQIRRETTTVVKSGKKEDV